jgi:hypothetical protein
MMSAQNATDQERKRLMIDILEEAIDIVTGNRQKDYGPPENSFEKIASLWTAYMNQEMQYTAQDVAMMMILLKVGRVPLYGEPTRDTLVDIAGYAAIASYLKNDP